MGRHRAEPAGSGGRLAPIAGASVVYHAAQAGAVVSLVDAGRPGAAVTANAFARFGASGACRRCRLAERTLAAVRSTFRGAAGVELLSTRVGVRPMPADGEPIVGPVADVPGLYPAVMHSAVTLAAVMGRLIARELTDGIVEPALAGCRLDRFC